MKKIAIVHDWLVTYAGAERVLEQMLQCYPTADLFSVVDFLPQDQRYFIRNKPVTTSFIQRLPFAKKQYRYYLPLMPLAIEQLDLSQYDLVLSSSHAVAKGVLTGPHQTHVCYCHSPMRYVWDLKMQYLEGLRATRGIKSWLLRYWFYRIRMWDATSSNGVDQFIANSQFVQRRIQKCYRRTATVIYPPVDVSAFSVAEQKEDFYLTASRMVPYKKIPLIVAAFSNMPEKRLVVIGDGPDFSTVRAMAGRNVEVLGYQPFEVLRRYMQRARAFVFAAEEDFGIAPLEAQACGTPVIAYGKGGALETIRGVESAVPTGFFFSEQSTTAIQTAIRQFEETGTAITAAACRQNAERFSPERFRRELHTYVEECCTKSQENLNGHPR